MPARFRDIIQVLGAYGVTAEEPGSGSHWKLRGKRPDGSATCFPIPAHNGEKTEIADKYIKKMCAAFGISFDEFWKSLKG